MARAIGCIALGHASGANGSEVARRVQGLVCSRRGYWQRLYRTGNQRRAHARGPGSRLSARLASAFIWRWPMCAESLFQGVGHDRPDGGKQLRPRDPPELRGLLREDQARRGRAAVVVKRYEPITPGGRGWRIVVDEMVVATRIGLYDRE